MRGWPVHVAAMFVLCEGVEGIGWLVVSGALLGRVGGVVAGAVQSQVRFEGGMRLIWVQMIR